MVVELGDAELVAGLVLRRLRYVVDGGDLARPHRTSVNHSCANGFQPGREQRIVSVLAARWIRHPSASLVAKPLSERITAGKSPAVSVRCRHEASEFIQSRDELPAVCKKVFETLIPATLRTVRHRDNAGEAGLNKGDSIELSHRDDHLLIGSRVPGEAIEVPQHQVAPCLRPGHVALAASELGVVDLPADAVVEPQRPRIDAVHAELRAQDRVQPALLRAGARAPG